MNFNDLVTTCCYDTVLDVFSRRNGDGLASDLVNASNCRYLHDFLNFIGFERGFCIEELTLGAIIVSATAALIVGILGWRSNRKLAREQAAVTLILEREMALRDDFRALWMLIQKHGDSPSFFKNLAEHHPVGTEGRDWDEDRVVLHLPLEQRQWLVLSTCLHYFEAIAVAINRGAIDRKTAAQFLKGKFVYYIQAIYPFIRRVRESEYADSKTWE